MSYRILSLSVICGLWLTGNAWAHSTVKPQEPGEPSDNPSLQEILDELVVSGPAIDAGSNAPIELFEAGDGPVVTRLVLSFADAQERFAFGIYDPDDPTNLIALFDDRNDPAHPVSIAFNGDGSITIDGGVGAGTHEGFDGPFGFFLKRRDFGSCFADCDGPVFFFSEAELNGGEQRVKVFQGNGESTLQYPGLDPALFLSSEYLLAWETGLGGGNNGGFDNFIVSVSLVPEPGALALLGLALAALARTRRAART